MSVIQKIQEKYAKLMAIIIALALIIFVVMLAFENGGSLFQSMNTTSVGKINGKSVDYNEFSKMVDRYEGYYEQNGYPPNMVQQQAVESAWNWEIEQSILKSELDKLGLEVGTKELGDILYGTNPPDFLKNAFTDSTGFYNAQLAKQRVDELLRKKGGNAQEMQTREQVIATIADLETNRLSEKYRSLFSNSANVPRWFIEKDNADKSQMARISLVKDFYASNMDSTIKITDKEIQDYINKNKDDFKQLESRSIAYVTFSALPSATDSAEAKRRIEELKPQFDTTQNVSVFLSSNGSTIPYADIYAPKSMMQMPNKDTIQSLPVGRVFGPYLDAGTYTLAKMIDIKTLPDSVKCRHILVAGPERGGFEDSIASRKIDSIKAAIDGGASWADMALKYNSDATRTNGGEMTFASTTIQDKEGFAPEFGQFILFDGKPGDKKIVKTAFGYHYIQVLDFIKPEPHYKVAYMTKRIEISQETDNTADQQANEFASKSRDQKSFDANADALRAKGINKNLAPDISPMAYDIRGLGQARTFIKNIYKAKLGEVLTPEKVGDNYVVAIVTDIQKEGTQPVSKARLSVEPLLKNEKVAAKLKQRLGNPATLEAAAASLGGKPIETVDSLRISSNAYQQMPMAARSLTSEPKVIGAAFNPANKGKIVVIEGTNAIYAIRVDDVVTTPLGDANIAEQRKSKYEEAKRMAAGPTQALREKATIKDKRSEFF